MAALHWRRKTSIPLFPGAWPSSSVQDYDDASPERPSDPLLSPTTARDSSQRWSFPTALEKHNFEDIIEPNDPSRGRSTRHRDFRASPATLEFSCAPLSTSFSQESNLTEATTAASEGIITPEFIDAPAWTSHSDLFKGELVSQSEPFGSFQTRYHHGSATPDITIESPSPGSSPSVPQVQRLSATCLDEALLNLGSDLSPLSLPLSDFSFNFGSPAADQHCDLRPSLTSDSLPFVESSSSQSTRLQSPSGTATDFYPLPETELEEDPRTPSTSSSYSHYTDSPVLPLEGSPGRGDSPIPQITVRPFSLTSAELDAFAVAAGAATIASRSSVSIPTSFRSASDSVSVSAYASACETSPAHVHATQSAVASLALATACASIDAVHQCDYRHQCDCGFDPDTGATEGRKRSVPVPLIRPHTVSSRVDVGGQIGALDKGERPAKALGKMRKFGGRIMNLFKTGKMGSTSDELTVKTTTTTAVTAVEYRSEHPIPHPKTPPRESRLQRQSFVPNAASKISLGPSHRTSFLPMHDGASRPLISLPFQQGRTAQQASLQFPIPTHHDRDIQTQPDSHKTSVQFSRLPRARTRTAPSTPVRSSEAGDPEVHKSRRFSLTSALSRQRMDALRAAVTPHPPVPLFPRPARCYVPETGTWVEITGVREVTSSENAIIGDPGNDTRQSWSRAGVTASQTGNEESGHSGCAAFQALQTPPPSPIAVRRHSAVQQSPQTGTSVQEKTRRTRAFSLSSAISKRASRARSVIRGRRNGEDQSTSPEMPTSNDSSHGAAVTVTDAGVQFDMLTPAPSLSHLGTQYDADVQDNGSVGSARNEFPSTDSELDSMRFATTGDMRDSSIDGTSFEFYSTPSSYSTARVHTSGGYRGELGNDNSPLTKKLDLEPSSSFALGTSFGSEQDGVVDEHERDEERGFLRALGLEFDEIVNRARSG